MVDILLVGRAVHMLIQILLLSKLPVTEIALVHGAVVRIAGVPCVIVPVYEFVRDEALLTPFIEVFVDEFSVDVTSIGARSPLEMVGQAARRHEATAAKRALNR